MGGLPRWGRRRWRDRCGSGRRGRRGWRALAVHQEADLGDAGQVGVQGAADGEHGEGLGLNARGMGGGEAAGQVDDGEFGAGWLGAFGLGIAAMERLAVAGALELPAMFRAGSRKTWATELAPPGTGWAASGAA